MSGWRMLWLRFLRWFHWYNSGRRIVILQPGVLYMAPLGTPVDSVSGWVEIGYVEDGLTITKEGQ